MSIDVERLKVDPEYWDKVVPKNAVAAQDMGKGQHPCFFSQKGVEMFLEAGSESQLIYRPQPSHASLLTDAQAEARMGEPIVIESASIQQANVDGGLAFDNVVLRKASESPYPHYFKDVSNVDAIDLYHVAKLYEINDPALFHALKKIACAGKRGAKDQAQDVQEAIDALKRWQELNK